VNGNLIKSITSRYNPTQKTRLAETSGFVLCGLLLGSLDAIPSLKQRYGGYKTNMGKTMLAKDKCMKNKFHDKAYAGIGLVELDTRDAGQDEIYRE